MLQVSKMSRQTPEPAIKYPCYVPFDPFMDVQRLRSLDAYVGERVAGYLAAERGVGFYTGPFRLDPASRDRPGSRMIYLTRSVRPDTYYDLDKAELWHPSEAAGEFAELMDFIATLPFKGIGRAIIMYDDVPRPVPAHRDHDSRELCHEFVWFRTNLRKPFYMLNPDTDEKQYVQSYGAWFDTVNQYHGADSGEGLCWSIRVDGVFDDAFRKQIPVAGDNAAAAPALWACSGAGSERAL